MAPTGRGGINQPPNPLPQWKIHFGVSEPNSFYTVTYTYIDSLIPRGQSNLQNSRDEVLSKLSRDVDENLKIKN